MNLANYKWTGNHAIGANASSPILINMAVAHTIISAKDVRLMQPTCSVAFPNLQVKDAADTISTLNLFHFVVLHLVCPIVSGQRALRPYS